MKKLFAIATVSILLVGAGVARATTLTNLYSFGGYFAPDGNQSFMGLVEGTDGNFYGGTYFGGFNGGGSIIRFRQNGGHVVLFSFNIADGASPYGRGLVRAT